MQQRVDDSQCVSLQLNSSKYLCFQVNTGVQCNAVPPYLYKKETKDYKLTHVRSVGRGLLHTEGRSSKW